MIHSLEAFADELVKVGQDPIESAMKSVDHRKSRDLKVKDDGSLGQNVAVAGAAASPFAGMIGQQKIQHDPTKNKSIRRFKNINELARHARPGDVIVTSKKKSIWKATQSPVFGSEFYHAQPVVGKRGAYGTTASAGNYRDKAYKGLSHKNFASEILTIGKEMQAEKYKDVVLLRPNKPLKGAELKTFVSQSMDRSRTRYDTNRAIQAWAKDVFLPKIVPASVLDRMEGTTKIQYRMIKDPDTGKLARRAFRCNGNVCSTLPAMALEEATGRRVVPGKMSKDVLPADYLRSKEFKAEGAVVGQAGRVSRYKPLAVRAGLGVGLAGAVYAGTDKPELAAGAAGVVAGTAAHKALAYRLGRKKGLSDKQIRKNLPSLMRTADEFLNAEKGQGRKVIGKYLKKGLPAKLVGGAAAYATARHFLNRKKNASSSS